MHGKARKGHRYYACGYACTYGDTAAVEAHEGQKSISVREDWLERLVLRFFEQRIFGPLRLEKLAKQLRAHDRQQRRSGQLAGTRIRQQVSDLDRKIKAQVVALEEGIEPKLVSERIGELREQKEALEDAWPGSAANGRQPEDEELIDQLDRIPDLTEALDGIPADQAPGLRVLRPPDRLRQAGIPGGDHGNRLGGHRRSLPERENPPGGGFERGSDEHSGDRI